MRSLGIFTLFSVAATAAAPTLSPASFTTAKSSQAFIQCFARSQDRVAAAWAFVPKAGGGTFSNLGAPSVTKPYFLAVNDRGEHREILIDNAGRGSAALEGAQQCI
jgi:hypothetical protein